MENEKRLIDANSLKDVIQEVIEENEPSLFTKVLIQMGYVLDACPTVDAMEVVRCLKCRYRSQHSDDNGMYKCGGLQAGNGDVVAMVKPDFFCAYGERRANDIQTV